MNSERNRDARAATATGRVGRRGLLGILGAVGVGFAAKKLVEPESARAADPNDVVKNVNNLVNDRTELHSAVAAFGSTVGFEADMAAATTNVDAIVGRGGGTGEGVQGFGGPTNGDGMVGTGGGSGTGVIGWGGPSDGTGVTGRGGGNGPGGRFEGGVTQGTGVFGTGNGVSSGGSFVGGSDNGAGVRGTGGGHGAGGVFVGGDASGTGIVTDAGSPHGYGLSAFSHGGGIAVVGNAAFYADAQGSGVEGRSRATHSSNGDRAGVRGTNSADGPGVVGISNNGIGVYGYNTGSGDGDPAACGGFFTTLANNTNAMVAQVFNNVTNAAAFVGSAAAGGGRLAGYFFGDTQFSGNEQHTGNVNITGNLTVSGAKNAVVPMADGQLHRVYSMESPEAWFEDFGRGTLQRGSARVNLPADFAQVADMSDYHVFLTPTGGGGLLGVKDQSASGFRVVSEGGSATGFSYRLVAKRKDIAAPRLEAFTPPPVRTVRLNTVPPTGPADAAPPAAPPPSPAPAPAPRGR